MSPFFEYDFVVILNKKWIEINVPMLCCFDFCWDLTLSDMIRESEQTFQDVNARRHS